MFSFTKDHGLKKELGIKKPLNVVSDRRRSGRSSKETKIITSIANARKWLNLNIDKYNEVYKDFFQKVKDKLTTRKKNSKPIIDKYFEKCS